MLQNMLLNGFQESIQVLNIVQKTKNSQTLNNTRNYNLYEKIIKDFTLKVSSKVNKPGPRNCHTDPVPAC